MFLKLEAVIADYCTHEAESVEFQHVFPAKDAGRAACDAATPVVPSRAGRPTGSPSRPPPEASCAALPRVRV